ncbi:MAG: hypothetical protein WC716_02955 [Chitinophagaceae bacterium]|jgi:hypothetical protein
MIGEKEVVKNKLNIWLEIWKTSTDNFLKNEFFGLTLYNPHILIDEIKTEIEENELRSTPNKEYLYLKVDEYLKNDEIVKENFEIQFQILRRIFKSNRNSYILEICNELAGKFKVGFYFEKCLEKIIDILTDDKTPSSFVLQELEYYTQGIIIEFIKKGYIVKDIKDFCPNILDNVREFKTGKGVRFITNFPHEINPEIYIKNDVFDAGNYDADVNVYMNGLNIIQRIKRLNQYYKKVRKKVHYIFVIEGMKGEIDYKINNVTFYNPHKTQFLCDSKTLSSENLQSTNEIYTQAAVEISMLSPLSSLTDALTDLDNSLDLISCYLSIKGIGLQVNKSKTILVENGKRLRTINNFGEEKVSNKHHYSINVEDFDYALEEMKNSFFGRNILTDNKSIKKILTALHWYRKAESSVKQEDKILNYWIAIENLFNTKVNISLEILGDSDKSNFEVIQSVIASEQILKHIFFNGWEFYHHYDNHTYLVDYIPEDIKQKANLNVEEGKEIVLEKFINTLPQIIPYEKSFYLTEKMNELFNFYTNIEVTKEKIDRKTKLIKEEVLMIYRFRNLIVHNAHFDNTILPFFVWRARYYAGDLIRRIIGCMSENKTLTDVILGIHLKKEQLDGELKCGKINLFKDRFSED